MKDIPPTMRDQVNKVAKINRRSSILIDIFSIPAIFTMIVFMVTWSLEKAAYWFVIAYAVEALWSKLSHDFRRVKDGG